MEMGKILQNDMSSTIIATRSCAANLNVLIGFEVFVKLFAILSH